MRQVHIGDSVELPGDPLGLGPGPHAACAVDWSALSPDDADRFAVDHLGDDFLTVVPGAFERDDLGRRIWRRTTLEPIAIVGGADLRELGRSWRDALPAAAVLFLDHASVPPAVVGWSGNPLGRLVAVELAADP
jgi:hypothetical protein